ncbi:MAG: hypothetical protein LC704_01435, partial [Actinobacteria bacterium]|nr:hypothetical protein [Actinomycetota bacterium]
DSEGEEGKFYVWTSAEIRGVLDEEDATLAERYWDVTERGNFEGKNILYVPRPPEAVAAEFGISPEDLRERIEGIRSTLFAEREKRTRPGRDEKTLAAWNGLMLRSFAFAARVLNREDYREVAERNATFLLDRLRVDGRLRRSYKDGQAKFNGYLEDYAMVADGLVTLYEATFQTRWLAEAENLCDAVLELFWDEGSGAFYDTPADHEERLRQRRAVGHLRRHRRSLAALAPPRPRGLPRPRRVRARRVEWRHGEVARRVRAPAGRAGLPPLAAARDRHNRGPRLS